MQWLTEERKMRFGSIARFKKSPGDSKNWIISMVLKYYLNVENRMDRTNAQ